MPSAGPTPTSQLLVPGRFGKALDGARGGVEIGFLPAYTQTPLTVECWMKPMALAQAFVGCWPRPLAANWVLYLGNTGEFGVRSTRWAPQGVWCRENLTDTQWHYLAMTCDGQAICLYIDGRQCASAPVHDATPAPNAAGPLLMGTILTPHDHQKSQMHVEEVRLSNIVRQIAAIPAAPLPADEHTVGLWRLNPRAAAGRVPDESALGNDGQTQCIVPVAMDELDRQSFHAGPSPLDPPVETISLQPGRADHPSGPRKIALDGLWEMAENGPMLDRLQQPWGDALPATVPGSVHSALGVAGRLADPTFGRNDAAARAQSFQTWWFKRTFPGPASKGDARLIFDGLAIRGTLWLNGTLLGSHEGMFGGPVFDITGLLQDTNTLIVRLDPAPYSVPFFNGDNAGWKKTVVFNNVYGWHYSDIPALGIWRSVRVETAPAVKIKDPFVATRHAAGGVADIVLHLGGNPGTTGRLIGTIAPENFTGPSLHFTRPTQITHEDRPIHLQLTIPQPRPWWPNGLGEPNLYRLTLSFIPDRGGISDTCQTTFGLRTIAMAPLPAGAKSDCYNWTFLINGQAHFLKGTGWCTMDSSMDFGRARYARFLGLARAQHCQMIRAWGSGMPETDDFYDLCDRYGLLVMQEWPTAWNSHNDQPFELLEETVRLNTLRLRNHPALALYGGGNESPLPFGPAIDMMGRHAIELDGTRPFHRGEPWGGSDHNYDCWWGQAHLDYNLKMTSPFFGEFGIASLPVYESVQRYLPDEEKNLWPAPPDGSFAHHTPIFNRAQDVARLTQYSGYFSAGATMQRFIWGTQLAQAVALRHPLERARTRWPECTGALYYKMNDNYPAASWSTADWYGAAKIAHYFCQDALAPLHAAVLFESVNNQGRHLALPVFLLDDADALRSAAWQVRVRAFDGQLQLITQQVWEGRGHVPCVQRLGEFVLTEQQTIAAPLFVVTQVLKDGVRVDRSFYFLNYEAVKDSLLDLPRTHLRLRLQDGAAVVTNLGKLPAIGAAVLRPGHLDTFTADDNYFWLDPGESQVVTVNTTTGLSVEAWNSRSWQ